MFAVLDPETQAEQHSEYMKKIFFICLIGVILTNAVSFCMENLKRYMGVDVVKKTLTKIMKAPINLFFDVTPLGKILQIFNEDMNVFKGEIVMPMEHCANMATHMFVVVSLMFAVGDWEVLVSFTVLSFFIYSICKPWDATHN